MILSSAESDVGERSAQTAGKAYETGKSVLVRVGNEERVEFLNALLWTYNDQSFLPHGSKKDGNAELQPIWLTSGTDNPNMASLLFWLTALRQTTANWKNSPAFLTFLTETHLTPCNRPGLFGKSEKRRQRMFYWQQDANGRWKQA